MRILVSEYVSGGAWRDPQPPAESLLIEGATMLRAVVQDLGRIGGVSVVTTCDRRYPASNIPAGEQIQVHSVTGPAEHAARLDELAGTCDGVLMIAPEFQGILAEQCRRVEAAGGRLIGPSSTAVDVCTDKLQMPRLLISAGIPTIETWEFHAGRTEAGDIRFPAVIKPRDGAGSQATFLVRAATDLLHLENTFRCEPMLQQAIWQPFVSGTAVSAALLIGPEAGHVELFPVCAQHLSSNDRFQYLGGTVCRGIAGAGEVQATALHACRTIAGLRGYVGVDLIIPDGPGALPLVVEINPRLTTSYIGYQALCCENIAARMLGLGGSGRMKWREGAVSWDCTGLRPSRPQG